jgi:hypothetical protein
MTKLGFVHNAIGTPFETLTGLELEQDPTYWAGNGLGWLPEHVVADLLRDASEGPMRGSTAIGFKERFEKIDYVVVDLWRGEIFGLAQAKQGRFEFELKILPGPTYELNVNVPWHLNVLPGVVSAQAQIIDAVNLALANYWIAGPDGRVELVSRIDGLTIPIILRVALVPKSDSFAWEIKVYPDSAATVEHAEVVWMSDFSWSMRETYSFRPREDHPQKAGRGPHEVGHMMGIPHDVADRYTVMSTIDDLGFDHWRYSLGGDASPILRPYAAHFKLCKVWSEMVFANQLGRLEDFIVRLPGWR